MKKYIYIVRYDADGFAGHRQVTATNEINALARAKRIVRREVGLTGTEDRYRIVHQVPKKES